MEGRDRQPRMAVMLIRPALIFITAVPGLFAPAVSAPVPIIFDTNKGGDCDYVGVPMILQIAVERGEAIRFDANRIAIWEHTCYGCFSCMGVVEIGVRNPVEKSAR